MGQPITVVEKPSSRRGIVRFEVNRPLSGMGHERWTEADTIEGDRPVDELARRLFAQGGVEAIHMNGSVVTVTLSRGHHAEGLADVVRSLFRFYPDQPGNSAPAEPPAGEGEGHGESEADPREDPSAVEAEEPAARAEREATGPRPAPTDAPPATPSDAMSESPDVALADSADDATP